MKKIVILYIILILASASASAQMFETGDKVLNLGVGLGNTWGDLSSADIGLPQVSASFDYGLRDDLGPGTIGIGGILSYESRKIGYSGYGWKGSRFILATRGTYHYSFIDKLDTYGVLVLGLGFNSYKATGDYANIPGFNLRSNDVDFIFRISAGARYNFTENFGIFGEIGYGISIFVFGVSLDL